MVKQVVVTRPHHDNETAYLHSFMKEILAVGKNLPGIHVTDLEGNSATRRLFESKTRDGVNLICLNGHGTAYDVKGHNDEPILDRDNLSITKGAIVHALACDSLVKLGKQSVEQGALAYIGYSAKFMISCDPTRSSSPEKDRNAAPIRQACNLMVTSLLQGQKVQKAIDLTKREYKKLIKAYGNSEDDPYSDAVLIGFALAWNLSFLNFVGDGSACM